MSKKRFILLIFFMTSLCVIIILGLYFGISLKKPEFLTSTQIIMGTTVEISIYPSDEKALEEAFNEIKKVDNLMSIYKEDSEVSSLNRQGEMEVSSETLKVIKKALEFSQISGGAFDITCKPLINLWKKAKKEMKVPGEEEINKALSSVGYEKIILKGNLVSFKEKGMQIDLGGIAKGYAVDKAIEVLKKKGIKRALVDAGGDLYVLGESPEGEKWQIGIQDPRHQDKIFSVIKLKDKGVATSGDYRRYFTIEGKRYSHIVDPKTGQTVEDVPMSVTIVAPEATTADALATGIFVLGPEKGMELLNSLPEAEGMIISEGMKVKTSRGWKQFQN